MRKLLGLVAACSVLSFGTVTSAGAPTFPDFVPMDAGPEGVVVDNVGNVYVTVSVPDGVEIRTFTPAGDESVLATLPGGTGAGMAIAPNGKTLYAAIGFVGVFAIGLDGGYELVPGTDDIVLPNSLAFDQRGNLYISETFSFDVDDGLSYYPACDGVVFDGWFGRGGIWVVPEGGEAELLLRDDLLTGVCLPNPIPYPIGANGLAYDRGELVVANTERALVIEVPVLGTTALGTPQVLTHVDELGPFGPWLLDGLALDVHGDVHVAAITGAALVHVDRDTGDYESTISDQLDFPASLAFGTGKGERQNVFVTNLALGGAGAAGPSLAKIAIGTPGMPLP